MSDNIKKYFSILQGAVWVITVLVGIFVYYSNKEKDRAMMKGELQTLQKNQQEIMNKLKENDTKFLIQSELNGKIIMYIQLDSNK